MALRKDKAQLENIKKTVTTKKQKEIDRVRFPTGSDLLNTIVGGGEGDGYPGGKIVNLVGDKSSGKTFLACEMIAAAKHKFKKRLRWIYDDCESGFSFNTTNLYGFEIMPTVIEDRHRSQTVEQLYCNAREFFESLKGDEIGIYVVDSLDGLTSDEGTILADERYKAYKTGAKFKQGSFRMGKPKYLSQEFFPKLAELVEQKQALLVVISQVRTNIDPMSFERFSRAGGKAMDFYCHTVLWLAQVNKIKRKNRSVGITIKAKTTKSKTPRPYREIFLSVLFDYGVDNITSNVDFLFDFLTKTGMIAKNPHAVWESSSCAIEDIKTFLADVKKEDWYRENVHPKLKKVEVLEWLALEENKKLKMKFDTRFSADMARDELISYIYDHKLESQLSDRIREKWEAIEASIRTNRPPKYID
jgi:recombination protein RecA